MSENMNLESFDTKLDDEHRVEQRIYETNIDGNKERVIETNVEKTLFGIPVSFQEKVTERTVPVVASRKREIYKDGKLMETVVEELDGSLMKLQPVTPIVPPAPVVNTVATAAPVVNTSNALTKEDLVQAMREVLEAVLKKVEPVLELPEDVVPVVPTPAPAPTPVPTPTPAPAQSDSWESLAWVILSGELAFCVYNLVLKNWF